MNITEVRVVLVDSNEDRLKAYCSVTFDHCFVVRDLKIIDGVNGPFVAMPSRRMTVNCPQCGDKNQVRARFCNACGSRIDRAAARTAAAQTDRSHADIAHPINVEFREEIHRVVLDAYATELAAAQGDNRVDDEETSLRAPKSSKQPSDRDSIDLD